MVDSTVRRIATRQRAAERRARNFRVSLGELLVTMGVLPDYHSLTDKALLATADSIAHEFREHHVVCAYPHDLVGREDP